MIQLLVSFILDAEFVCLAVHFASHLVDLSIMMLIGAAEA